MERASDDAKPRHSGTRTCSRRVKATRWAFCCETAWRTCRRQRVGHETIVASVWSMRIKWQLQCRRIDPQRPRGRSGIAGENPLPIWADVKGLPNRGWLLLDTANWDSRRFVLAAHSRPVIDQIKQ